jgi:uncharacterized protein YkwD
MDRRVGSILCVLAAIAAVVALLPAGASASGTRHTSALTVDLGILAQLNQIRAAHGLAPLSLCPKLSAAAMQHSRDMLAKGYFAHNSADGQPFWKRIKAYYPEPRYGYWSVGENLYWASGSPTATESMRAWMASPEHRANILDRAWRQIGIATVEAANAPGTFAHLDATVITTDFGVRR